MAPNLPSYCSDTAVKNIGVQSATTALQRQQVRHARAERDLSKDLQNVPLSGVVWEAHRAQRVLSNDPWNDPLGGVIWQIIELECFKKCRPITDPNGLTQPGKI
uniref:Uncharacterized protein n=1 Tax=Vespula pensylvanica TaxID=30213 RepID=A0A834U4B8_VESPE|nr:hypothetical protein H0235_012602 [Vespula pensylvanica]